MKVNIHDAKTHLSRYLEEVVSKGKSIILCNRNVPVAEIRPLPIRSKPRLLGLAKGQLRVTKRFFEPLPRETLAGFEGGSD